MRKTKTIERRGIARLHGSDGQITVTLGIAVVLLAVGAIALIAALGGTAVDRARARTAADAAALAGAADGRATAREVAERNGGVLESIAEVDGQTEVTVRVGRARATSRAVRTPANQARTGSPGSCCAALFPYTRSDVFVRAPAHLPRR